MISQLRIITNPHLEKSEDQQQLVNELMARRRRLAGIEDEQIDRAGMARLKDVLKNESKSKIKVK